MLHGEAGGVARIIRGIIGGISFIGSSAILK